MKTLLKSVVAVVAMAAPVASFSTVASAAKAPSHAYVAGCDKTKLYKPYNMAISCTNANLFLSKMIWSTWTTTSASGSGRLVNGNTTMGSFTLSGATTKNGVTYFTKLSGTGISKPLALPKP